MKIIATIREVAGPRNRHGTFEFEGPEHATPAQARDLADHHFVLHQRSLDVRWKPWEDHSDSCFIIESASIQPRHTEGVLTRYVNLEANALPWDETVRLNAHLSLGAARDTEDVHFLYFTASPGGSAPVPLELYRSNLIYRPEFEDFLSSVRHCLKWGPDLNHLAHLSGWLSDDAFMQAFSGELMDTPGEVQP